MRIPLEYGDDISLSKEIDTQKIRNARRYFSYEKFLENAGINLLRQQSSIHDEIEIQLTNTERRIAEQTVEDMKRALINEDLTLYQVAGISATDTSVLWENFKNGIDDFLRAFWIKLSSDKDKYALFKLYLCDPKSNVISTERLNKVFDIEITPKSRRDDELNLFGDEESKLFFNIQQFISVSQFT